MASFLALACGGRQESNRTGQPAAGGAFAGTSGLNGGTASVGGAQIVGGGGAAAAGRPQDVPEGGAAGGETEAGGVGGEAPVTEGPHPYRALQLASGRYHSCALLENHGVKCWGANGYGQLGLGDSTERGLRPEQMGDALPFVDLGSGRSAKAIAAGRYTTCAILDDSSVKCWGLAILGAPLAFAGQVGDTPGEMGDQLPPLPLGPGRSAKAVGLGFYDGCVARDDDSFYCGGTSDAPVTIPAAPSGNVVSLAGSWQAMALYDDGTVRGARASVMGGPVSVATDVISMAGSRELQCFWLKTGKLDCGANPPNPFPKTLPAASSIALTERRSLCAVVEGGKVQCWGGVFPAWAMVQDDGSMLLPLAGPAIQVAGGGDNHLCALQANGAVVCWAYDSEVNSAVGSNDAGAVQLKPVDLGTAPGR